MKIIRVEKKADANQGTLIQELLSQTAISISSQDKLVTNVTNLGSFVNLMSPEEKRILKRSSDDFEYLAERFSNMARKIKAKIK